MKYRLSFDRRPFLYSEILVYKWNGIITVPMLVTLVFESFDVSVPAF